MSKSLSLWKLEAELANLLNLRDELAETGEDLAPLDLAIGEYIARKIKKVDGIRSFLKHAEMMAAAAEAEAKTQTKRAKIWRGRIDRLKQACQFVMEAMTWKPDQVRRIDGKTGSLTLKTNGGKQEVVITKPDLLPEDLVQYEGRISGQAWAILRVMLNPILLSGRSITGKEIEEKTAWEYFTDRQDVQMERVPHKGRIAEALSAKCSYCNGSGESLPTKCRACDGDGLARVPGAHFASRGNHVECR